MQNSACSLASWFWGATCLAGCLQLSGSGLALTWPAALDPSFQSRSIVDGTVRAIAVQNDGKVLAGGDLVISESGNVQTNIGLVRLLDDGSVDPGFARSLTASPMVESLAIQPDGKLLVANAYQLQRLNSDGTPDPTFNPV